jgi:hypothetical protein
LVTRDLEDARHDRKVLDGEIADSTRFLCPEWPCPTPDQCQWDGRVCLTCGRKAGLHAETLRLKGIGLALEGGMPMERDDLSLAQWQALGLVRADMRPGF